MNASAYSDSEELRTDLAGPGRTLVYRVGLIDPSFAGGRDGHCHPCIVLAGLSLGQTHGSKRPK